MADAIEYWKVGAVAGALGGVILGGISKLVSAIPGVSLDLQSISISTTGVGSVVNTGMSKYAQKLLGLLPVTLSGMDWVMLAIGGAMFAVLGAFIYDSVKMLQFAKSKSGKLATIFVVAGLVTGAILSMSLSIPAISAAIIMAVDALILSFILVFLDNATGLKLVP